MDRDLAQLEELVASTNASIEAESDSEETQRPSSILSQSSYELVEEQPEAAHALDAPTPQNEERQEDTPSGSEKPADEPLEIESTLENSVEAPESEPMGVENSLKSLTINPTPAVVTGDEAAEEGGEIAPTHEDAPVIPSLKPIESEQAETVSPPPAPAANGTTFVRDYDSSALDSHSQTEETSFGNEPAQDMVGREPETTESMKEGRNEDEPAASEVVSRGQSPHQAPSASDTIRLVRGDLQDLSAVDSNEDIATPNPAVGPEAENNSRTIQVDEPEATSEAPAYAKDPAPGKVDDDSQTVYLYVSFAAGTRGVMKNLNFAKNILDSYEIPYTVVEISMDETARRRWKYKGIAKNKKLPAVFRDGDLKLDFDGLLEANETEEVDEIIYDDF